MMKKVLMVFAVIVFVFCFVLAIYYGAAGAKEIVVNGYNTEEKFNFGLFLIGFMKYIAIGLVGGGVLLGISKLCPDY